MKEKDPNLFLWRDHWLGVYRKGFGAVIQADVKIRRTAQVRALVVFSAILMVVFAWFYRLPVEDPGRVAYETSIRLQEKGRTGEAVDAIRAAIEKSPKRLRYRLRLAWLGIVDNQLSLVGEAFLGAITVSPMTLAVLLISLIVLYYGAIIYTLFAHSKARRRRLTLR